MFPLNEVMEIRRPVRISDGQGGYIQSYQVVGRYPCRISSPSVTDRAYAGAMQQALDVTFYCGLNADIRIEDRISCRGAEYIAQQPVINSVQVFQKIGAAIVKN